MHLYFNHLDGMYKSPPEVGTFCQASILCQRGREPIANSISYMTSGNPKTTLSASPFFPFTKHGCTQTKVT